MCTQMGLIWLPVHRRPHIAGSPERLDDDSDSGSQECELCDMQPGSRPCTVIVQPTTASLEIRGQFAFKKEIFATHLCLWNNIHLVFLRKRQRDRVKGRERGRGRKRREGREERREGGRQRGEGRREWLDPNSKLASDSVICTPAHTTFPLTHPSLPTWSPSEW